MLTENYVKAGNVMENKYSRLQISIHWLVFLLVIAAYCAMELGHLVIYLLFIALPVIGLVMMYNRGNPWFAFGLTMPYASEANFERVDSLKSWHETLANLGYFLIGLHAAAALAHHYFWKDNTLLRMMPRKRS